MHYLFMHFRPFPSDKKVDLMCVFSFLSSQVFIIMYIHIQSTVSLCSLKDDSGEEFQDEDQEWTPQMVSKLDGKGKVRILESREK